mgnify:CR=1 FL=1
MKKTRRRTYICLIFASLLFLSCKTEIFAQDMPIMVWYGPSVKSVNPFDLLMIHQTGFNTCLIDFKESKLNEKALSFADSLNLDLYLTDNAIERVKNGVDSSLFIIDSLTAVYRSYPSFCGYYLAEKPGLNDFASLSILIDYFRSRHSSLNYFIQCQPEYATPASLDTTDYQAYLSLAMRKLKPAFLSYEHFGILKDEFRDEFYTNLEHVRQISSRYDVPFWAFALLVSFGDHPQVAHSHVRAQLYSGLAYGAKGVQYYSFRPPAGNSYEYGDAMLSREGDPTDALSFCRLINSEIAKLGPTLLRLTSTGIYFSEPAPPGGKTFTPGLPIIKIDSPSILAGFFEDEYAQQYVMFVNTDFAHGKRAKIHFSEKVQALLEVSKNYMPPLVIEWEEELYKDADILFKAGDGRLFQIIE